MQNALEESRALLETADRQRRSAEQELADTNETLADLGNVNQSIAAAKRKLESEYNQLGVRIFCNMFYYIFLNRLIWMR